VQAVPQLTGLDPQKILSILRSWNKAVLFLKVGYLLQKYFPDRFDDAFFKECLSYRSKKRTYWGTKVGLGVSIKEWNLIVPRNRENELIDLIY
jgi:hypothetical protein